MMHMVSGVQIPADSAAPLVRGVCGDVVQSSCDGSAFIMWWFGWFARHHRHLGGVGALYTLIPAKLYTWRCQ